MYHLGHLDAMFKPFHSDWWRTVVHKKEERSRADCRESKPRSPAPDTSYLLTQSVSPGPVSFHINAYLVGLLPGAHRLKQPLDLHLMLHSLFIQIAQKVLQHALFLLQALAQLLSHFTLTGSQFAEECCPEILMWKGRCEFLEDRIFSTEPRRACKQAPTVKSL